MVAGLVDGIFRTAMVGWLVAFFLFSFSSSSFIDFNKHNTMTEHSSVHLSLAMHNGHSYTTDMHYLCTRNNYTKRYTVTQTHGHTDKQSDKRIVDSHTQTFAVSDSLY